jgi:hypothetical protein
VLILALFMHKSTHLNWYFCLSFSAFKTKKQLLLPCFQHSSAKFDSHVLISKLSGPSLHHTYIKLATTAYGHENLYVDACFLLCSCIPARANFMQELRYKVNFKQ